MITQKTESNFYGEIEYLIDEETGHEYQRIVSGIGWSVGIRPGFLVVIGETRPEKDKPKHQPHFYVLAEKEDFSVSNLLRACIAFKSTFFVSQFYGDTENRPVMENYYKLKTSFPLTSAPFIDDPNALNSYISQIRECTSIGKKRLHFGGSSLGTRLLEIPAEKIRRATKAQDFPLLFALGGALSALLTWPHNPNEQRETDALNAELADWHDD